MLKRPIFGAIAATAKGVIGRGGALPWYFEEETQYFRDLTLGCPVVMGHSTFDGIPKIFHTKRASVVLSRDRDLKCEFARVVNSLDESIQVANEIGQGDKIFMIGGAVTAEQFLKRGLLSAFMLTKIHEPFEGDVILDMGLLRGWNEKIIRRTADFTICELTPPR